MGNKFIASCLTLAMVGASLGGCASSPKSITASYVSPLQYQSYDCDQITQEMYRITRRVQEVTGVQSSKASGDAVAVTASLLFWPALLFLAAGEDKSAELARLKGEAEALEQAAVQKKCTALLDQIEQERKAAEKTAAETAE